MAITAAALKLVDMTPSWTVLRCRSSFSDGIRTRRLPSANPLRKNTPVTAHRAHGTVRVDGPTSAAAVAVTNSTPMPNSSR